MKSAKNLTVKKYSKGNIQNIFVLITKRLIYIKLLLQNFPNKTINQTTKRKHYLTRNNC